MDVLFHIPEDLSLGGAVQSACISAHSRNSWFGIAMIDAMFYTPGSTEDYDGYAKVVGDPAWSWNNLQHIYTQSRRSLIPMLELILFHLLFRKNYGRLQPTASLISLYMDSMVQILLVSLASLLPHLILKLFGQASRPR